MTNDPFAGVPADEANEALRETPDTDTNTNKKENTVQVTDQAKIVTTLKGGSGYDAPWIVVHSDDATDALETLKDPTMKDLIETAQKVGSAFVQAGGGNRQQGGGNRGGGGNQGGGNRPNGQPQGANEAAVQTPPGYVLKSGIGKNGRPWKAFMGADRDANLPVIFLNDKGYPSPKYQDTYDQAMNN